MAADPRPRRFPVVLTALTAVAFAVLLGLGTWQVQRLGWKQDLLTRLEAARTGPASTLAEVLDRGPEGAAYSRVVTTCLRDLGSSAVYGLRDGQIAWRALTQCDVAEGRILVDRGVVVASVGSVTPPTLSLPKAGAFVGVLRPASPEVRRVADEDYLCPLKTGGECLDLILSVEIESPPVAALRPAPLPPQLSNNHLGYAITWYGLAAALIGVYVALLRKRLRS